MMSRATTIRFTVSIAFWKLFLEHQERQWRTWWVVQSTFINLSRERIEEHIEKICVWTAHMHNTCKQMNRYDASFVIIVCVWANCGERWLLFVAQQLYTLSHTYTFIPIERCMSLAIRCCHWHQNETSRKHFRISVNVLICFWSLDFCCVFKKISMTIQNIAINSSSRRWSHVEMSRIVWIAVNQKCLVNKIPSHITPIVSEAVWVCVLYRYFTLQVSKCLNFVILCDFACVSETM